MAAEYVGCAPATIRARPSATRSSPRSCGRPRATPNWAWCKSIRNAAKKEQYWRAAAWALERGFPEKYARRGPDVITVEQIGLLLDAVHRDHRNEVPERYRTDVLEATGRCGARAGHRAQAGGRKMIRTNPSPAAWPLPLEIVRHRWACGARPPGPPARPGPPAGPPRRRRARTCWPGAKNICRTISAGRPRSCTAGWPTSLTPPAPTAGHEAQRAGPARRRQVDHRHALPAAPRRPGRLGTVHLDRLRHQAPGRGPPGKPQGRAARQPPAGRRFSRGRRAGAGLAGQPDRAPQRRDDRGLRHRPADSRPPPPPAPPHPDRLRRLAERRAHPLGLAAGALAELVPRHADEGRHGAARTS